jgi:hypothetical protein
MKQMELNGKKDAIKKVLKVVKKAGKGQQELSARDILSIAPSEGEIPRDPCADLFALELAYPGAFGGKPRSIPIKKITRHYRYKFELRHKIRTFVKFPELLFAMTRQSYIKTMTSLEQISLRKIHKSSGQRYCAKDVRENQDTILKFNEGYRFLKTLRGSPPYYEKV